jgi:hemolysin activation/secretion protein
MRSEDFSDRNWNNGHGRQVKFSRFAAFLGMALVASLAGAQAPAPASSAPPEPRFEIGRFVVEGATLLTNEEIESAVGPFRGKSKDFADVQRALESIERLYATKGYNAVQVILPEQEVERGEVRFRVTEAKIGAMVIEGNKFFDEANIRASLPALAPGGSPNIHRIADNLRLANESPAKQTTVLLRGSAEEGVVDAVVRVSDERPMKYSMTLDNTGTTQTGAFRVGFGLQLANLFNLDHVLSMQYVTAPNDARHVDHFSIEPSKNVIILGGSYHIPIYRWGDSIDVTAGYSNVSSGVVQNLFNVSGAGTIFGIKYNYALPRWGDLEHRLGFGWDWRGFRSKVLPIGTDFSLVPDITVHPISSLYSGAYRQSSHETTFYLSYHQNLPGGNDGGSEAFQASRLGGRPGYTIWRYGVSHNRAFGNDWQMRAAFNGQATRERLVPGEQFGIGGIDSVRGFLEREVVSDHGYRGTIEAYSPDLAGLTDWFSGYRMRGVLFYDWGRVTRSEPLTSEPYRQSISSTGFGVRLSRGTNLSVRLDYAVVIDRGGLQNRGDGRMHATAAYIF